MIVSRTLPRLLSALALPLLAAAPTAGPAAVRTVAAPPAAPKPAVDAGIIALPLTPIVPAAQRSCTARTPSGLGYTMLRPGAGATPGEDATVLIDYIGYLAASGAVFDQNMRTPLPVNGVIPGFSEGLRLAARGGIVRLCIPAAMGYGAQESGPIPANSDLVFQIEVLDFKTAAEIEQMRKAGEAPTPNDGAPQP